jgi:hypothetical protein
VPLSQAQNSGDKTPIVEEIPGVIAAVKNRSPLHQ